MEEKESCGIMAIDLKSFYASCECVERGLDSMDAYLVVADGGRTEKTICLAVSPALKNFGIPGRPRLFEVIERVKEINYQRKRKTEERRLVGSSCLDSDLKAYSFLALSYITAPPRMALYMEYSRRVYEIYLRFVSREDIHVYSVDEVFIDLRPYEKIYRKSAEELAAEIARTVYGEMGIVATVGLGENLYLAKVAMDILAKHLKTLPKRTLGVSSHSRFLANRKRNGRKAGKLWNLYHGRYRVSLSFRGRKKAESDTAL